jgi:hypothetical protein
MKLSFRYMTRGALLGAPAVLVAACISPESPLLEESMQGCAELHSGGDLQQLDVHPKVRQLMVASVDLKGIITQLEKDVFQACASVATDLGAADSWSGLEGSRAISSSAGTGACDQAAAKIEQVLASAGTIELAIAVSRAQCKTSFEEQKQCDQQCSTTESCDPGTVETRCEPGALSVVCQGSCSAQATCVGTPEQPANCMGKCQSECVGQCQGSCIDAKGKKSENNPNCVGKCASSCNGTCRGLCKIEKADGLECGANVSCTGGCTASYSDPVCTTEFKPPECSLDTDCHDVCSSRVIAHAVCEPTRVQVFVDLEAYPELQPLADTLEKNLPVLIDAAEKQGKLALSAVRRIGDAGQRLQGHVDELDGKSLACTAETSTLLAQIIGSAEVAVDAALRVNLVVEHKSQ